MLLDGKAMRTPAKAALVLPTAAFAAAIAAEWSAQGEFLDANQLPLTRIANTTIDLVSADRTATQKTLTAWAETDLLCYRAEGPLGLVERQARAWQPLLDWVRSRYQAELITVAGLMPAAQPASALEALARAVAATDDWHLALLHEATAAAGSLVLGLALLDHRIDAETAFTLSVLDESWQIEQWGEDAEAAHRRAGLRADLAVIGRALALLDDAECTAARIPEGRLR